jgi:hypothetical protein
LALAACGSKSSSNNTDGAAGGNGILLTPSADGFIAADTNSAGVVGAWYRYGDWYGDDGSAGTGKCQVAGFTVDQCSTFTGSPTTLTGPFTPDAMNRMCASGNAAVVINGSNGMPDYADIFGAGLGLDFNNTGNDGGMGKKPFDMNAAHITGVSFDIDMVPGANLRVEFPTSAMTGVTDIYSAWWGGSGSNVSNVKPGTNSFTWDKVGGPNYTPPAAAGVATFPPFDPTKVLSIQFHVVTNTSSAVPFSFCIGNLTLLK